MPANDISPTRQAKTSGTTQDDSSRCAAAFALKKLGLAAVQDRNLRHEWQAESTAAAAAIRPWQGIEALEHAIARELRDAWPAITYIDANASRIR